MTAAADLFLAGARVVAEALAAPAVAGAWDRPSVLEDQSVGGLAGHLARGAVWAVGDYLDAGPPDGPVDFETAADYFAAFAARATADDHRGVRERGAAVAAAGHAAVVATLGERLAGLEDRLPALPGDHLVSVVGGLVMRLDDYLGTRVVEQVVHLDDLARSVDAGGWPVPPAALDLAAEVGLEVARRRHGDQAVVRALYRGGFAGGVLPVL